ncbi:MAG: hypothetical protein H0Z39_08850 [Peptococcaceae bacterium]|nr:hypothetical protein [Peptococcaceae bacterium]
MRWISVVVALILALCIGATTATASSANDKGKTIIEFPVETDFHKIAVKAKQSTPLPPGLTVTAKLGEIDLPVFKHVQKIREIRNKHGATIQEDYLVTAIAYASKDILDACFSGNTQIEPNAAPPDTLSNTDPMEGVRVVGQA